MWLKVLKLSIGPLGERGFSTRNCHSEHTFTLPDGNEDFFPYEELLSVEARRNDLFIVLVHGPGSCESAGQVLDSSEGEWSADECSRYGLPCHEDRPDLVCWPSCRGWEP